MSKFGVGKSISYLLWKTPKGKVNPKMLGWIRQDGIINFQSAKAAEDYATNRCVSALHASVPFERAVIVKNNQVLPEINGERLHVDMSRYSGKMLGASLFHGHPNLGENTTCPVSLDDYLVLVSQRLKQIVALNKNGEHSILTQNPQTSLFIRLLPQKWQEKLMYIEQIRNGSLATSEFAKEYAKMFPKEIQNKVEQSLHKQIGIPYANKSKIAELKKSKLTVDEVNTINSVNSRLAKDGTLSKNVHAIWKNIAKKLGCTYETNYAEFIKDT